MNERMQTFGKPAEFCVRIGWFEDPDPVAERPSDHGWSMGQLEIIVDGESLTACDTDEGPRQYVQWYLGPFLHWLAENWIELLHEEHFTWQGAELGPAARSCEKGVESWLDAEDDQDNEVADESYGKLEAWCQRHCISSAAEGGLFPEIYLRRFMDDGIEVSWTGRSPLFAPSGFSFQADEGRFYCGISAVAEAFWGVLQWVVHHPPALEYESFKDDWESLCQKVEKISKAPVEEFVKARFAQGVLGRVREAFAEKGREIMDGLQFEPESRPYLVAGDPAVAMFGGIEPDLSQGDICLLRDTILKQENKSDTEEMQRIFTDFSKTNPLKGKPYNDGYELAKKFIEWLAEKELLKTDDYVDVEALCDRLGIDILKEKFDTDKIRGVALAGERHHSTIILNDSNTFSESANARRFTMAHELCHIVFDRNRARSVSHVSGPWAMPEIEQRANAFAAYFLVPYHLLADSGIDYSSMTLKEFEGLARRFRVSRSHLAEHMRNLDFIDYDMRDSILAN